MYDLVFLHNSKTCTDPNCRCRTRRRTPSSVPEGATILSVRQQLTWNSPVSRLSLEKALRDLFLELSRHVLTDGIVPGHLKGILKVDSATFFISVTREDSTDESQNEVWENLDAVACAELTVNLLSVLPCELTNEALEDRIRDMHALLTEAVSAASHNS